MSGATLHFETSGGLGVLKLNRPAKHNAVNGQMLADLLSFWTDRQHDTETRVILMHGGESKSFCSGADLREPPLALLTDVDPREIYQMQVRFSSVISLMRRAPQPIVAAAHGAALGAGFSLLLATDIRLASPDARMAATYINIGLSGSDMGSSYLLPRLIGWSQASYYLLTGDDIPAEKALELGLVSQILPREELVPAARAIADKLLAKSPLGLRVTKEAIQLASGASSLEAAIHLEDRNQTLCLDIARRKALGK